MSRLSPDGPRLSVIIPSGLGLAAFFSFIAVGEQARGAIAGVFVVAISYGVIWKWDLRKHAWFWFVVAGLCALHAAVLFLVHWGVWRGPALALAPLAFADLAFVLAAISLFERLFRDSLRP